ncbi:MAG: type II secretion system protein [Candidatus Aminicenantes bacterium]|nr:type II secretion system protein [Candidatus Aminicenantes bacterium]
MKRKGFTLIELLIVVAIIGILAALLIPNALTAMQKAKQKGTMKDLATISTALTDHVTDNGNAPTHSGAITAEFQAVLSPFYIKVCPMNDQWGFPINVYSGQDADTDIRGCIFTGIDDFVVESYARDGAEGEDVYNPDEPENGLYIVTSMADFARDLVMFNGNWVIGPQTRSSVQD